MAQPLISIIVPCYNVGKYINQCVDSIRNQTYANIECICIDDGSVDDTYLRLKKYSEIDKRIHIISQQNKGVSAARNRGLKMATGDFIMFVDGDDWIDKDTCESALNAAIMEQAELVIWSYMREYPDRSLFTYVLGEKTKTWNERTAEQLYCRLIGLRQDELRTPQKIDSLVTVWGKLYKKELLDGMTFKSQNEIGATGEDLMFNIEVFRRLKRATYLPRGFSHYRKDNVESITSTYKYDLAEMWSKQYRMIYHQLESENRPEIFYEALSNRISLGLIGLGLSIIGDKCVNTIEKRSELKRLLAMPQYKESLKKLSLKYLPVHWKVFFLSLKHKLYLFTVFLLYVMNFMRSRR